MNRRFFITTAVAMLTAGSLLSSPTQAQTFKYTLTDLGTYLAQQDTLDLDGDRSVLVRTGAP
jgi:hypothetical protein